MPLGLASLSNPLNFKGPEFLSFYLLVASTAMVLVIILRWYLRKPAFQEPDVSNSLDAYEIGYLAGGNVRAVDAAIASLVQRGHLQPLKNILELGTPLPTNSHPLEYAIAQAAEKSGKPDKVRQAVTSTTILIKKHLQSLGLLMNSSQAQGVRRLSARPIFAVLLLGIAKIIVGISQHKPVGFLVILCIATAIVGNFLLAQKNYRSRYGDRILNQLQTKYSELKKPSSADTYPLGLAFSLFGRVILANSSFACLKCLLVPPKSTGDGDDSGCGYSGCGYGGYDVRDYDGGDSDGGDSDGGGGCGG
jgi:uncharacterized protein (TIGR04222 family)